VQSQQKTLVKKPRVFLASTRIKKWLLIIPSEPILISKSSWENDKCFARQTSLLFTTKTRMRYILLVLEFLLTTVNGDFIDSNVPFGCP